MFFYLLLFLLLLFPPALKAGWSAPFGLQFQEGKFPMEQFPRIARDGKGFSIAAWPLPNVGIQSARLHPTQGTWSEIQTVASGYSLYTSPWLCLDSFGTTTLVWLAFDASNHAFLQAARCPFNKTWSEVISLDLQTKDLDHLMVDTAGDEYGNVIAAWIADTNPTRIQAAVLGAHDKTWRSPALLGKDPFHHLTQAPALAISHDKGAVVWKSNSPKTQLQAQFFSFKQQKWVTPSFAIPMIGEPEDVISWSMTLDAQGNGLALFDFEKNDEKKIALSSFSPHSQEKQAMLLCSDSTKQPRLPFITLDKKGNAYLFWTELDQKSNTPLLITSCFSNQKLFSPAVQYIPKNLTASFYPLKVILDSDLNGISLFGSSLFSSSIDQPVKYLHKP